MHNPRNLGLYSYVWNNPLRFVDPDGRRTQSMPHPMQTLRAGMNSVRRWIDRAIEQAPHVALQAAGLIPEIGEVFDVADAALYAHEEEYGEATMSMAATVPVGGWGATFFRWLGKPGAKAATNHAPKALQGVMPRWTGKIIPYRKGPMTAMEHILYRHGHNSGFSNVGRFLEGTRAADIKNMVSEAARKGKWTWEDGRAKIEYDFRRGIGLHSDGSQATRLRVHLNHAGEVQTAFPVQ